MHNLFTSMYGTSTLIISTNSNPPKCGCRVGPPTLGWVAIRVDALTLAVSVHDHRRHLFFQDRQHLRQKTGDTVDHQRITCGTRFQHLNLELE